MTQERMQWTVKVIGRSIRYYQKKLTYQLELEAEEMFHNGLRKCNEIGDLESNIKTYETIIADLATIWRAISKGINHAGIYSIDEETEDLNSPQIYDVLVKRAKLHIVVGLDGELWFTPKENLESVLESYVHDWEEQISSENSAFGG